MPAIAAANNHIHKRTDLSFFARVFCGKKIYLFGHILPFSVNARSVFSERWIVFMKNSVKAVIIAAIVGVGVYSAVSMEDYVASSLKAVETMTMNRTAFRKSVSARGSVYSENNVWFVSASVDESDIGSVAVGQSVAISGAAFPETLNGTVDSISDEAVSQNGKTLVPVVIRISGGENLKNGYSAQGSIFVDEARLLNTLPYAVIRQDDDGEYVYVYDSNKAVMKRIETGVELSDETEIVSGISEKSEVILTPDDVSENALIRKAE